MQKKCFLFFVVVLAIGMITGCASKEDVEKIEEGNPPVQEQISEEKTEMKISLLKGPTGMGAVKLMEENDKKETVNQYQFEISSTPDEVVAKLVSGQIDAAAVPTNLASVLYQKTEGNIKIAAVNTLGVLYLLEKGNTIDSIEDLKGKTIYSSGQGATSEYVFQFLLDQNNITNTTIEYKTEHAELATAILAGQIDNALLPEPNVTAVLQKDPEIRIALNLSEEWVKSCQGTQWENSDLAMGCIVVRADFLEKNAEAFSQFLKEYQNSTHFVNENVQEAGLLIQKYGIMADAAAAEKAIPNCNIVYIDGQEMKEKVSAFYQILFQANPKSIGGNLPDDSFYITE